MKILIIYRHFWPDSPPYASMLRSIGGKLVQGGHDVTIWCEQPCYKAADGRQNMPRRETLDGIKIVRFRRLPLWAKLPPVRLIDKAIFPLRALAKAPFAKLGGAKYDLVWTATMPPVLQGWVGRMVSRFFGAKFLYHTQDLYPELAAHMGIWREGGVLYRILQKIERQNRAQADRIISLSDDMAETTRALASPRGKLVTLNNFMLDDFSEGDSDQNPDTNNIAKTEDVVELIFAGNLGQFQGLEHIVGAMKLIEKSHPNIRLTLMGEGTVLPLLKEQAKGMANVVFEPHRPFAEAQPRIAQAHVGIVSLEPEIYRFAFPSKTLTYLGLNLPILVIVEGHSRLARMIADNDIGWVAPERKAQSIANAIIDIAAEQDAISGKGRDSGNWYRANLDRPVLLNQWANEIGALENETAG